MGKFTYEQVKTYLETCYRMRPYYMYGADMQVITSDLIKKLSVIHGDTMYQKHSGYIGSYGCDCSGLMTPLTDMDRTAQGWYNKCNRTMTYSNRDSRLGLVFLGKSSKSITHMGILCGDYTYEMYNRLDKKTVKGGRWQWFGALDDWFEDQRTDTSKHTIGDDTVTLVHKVSGYKTAADALKGGYAPALLVPGTYWIYKTVVIDGERIYNLSADKAIPGSWVRLGVNA